MAKRRLGVVLFSGFELLDVFGPLEAFGGLKEDYELVLVAERAGPIASAQGPEAMARAAFTDCPPLDVLLVPGGIGTRREVGNPILLDWLARRAAEAEIVTSVCTGAALLARAGLLDGRRATSNKRAFQWVKEQGPRVVWIAAARWVDDGKFVTSAGVSAGLDMALHLIARTVGQDVAERAARIMEYEWHQDAAWDPFARLYA